MKYSIIYALGLHEGGGYIILINLLNSISKTSSKYKIYLDARLKKYEKNIPQNKNFEIIYLKNNLIHRFFTERKLSKEKYKKITFINGFPPLFHLPYHTSVLFQNLNIFNPKKTYRFYFSKDLLRYFIFKIGLKNADQWLVFNMFTKTWLSQKILIYQNINLVSLQFINIDKIKNRVPKVYDLIYPASGLSHKNHKYLIESLKILSKINIYPKLVLTLSKKEFDNMKIEKINHNFKTKIYNFNNLSRSKFLDLFKSCNVLIFPSNSETLGLPLYEAQKIGLKIFCSSLAFNQGFIKSDNIFELSDPFSLSRIIHDYYIKEYNLKINSSFNIKEIL